MYELVESLRNDLARTIMSNEVNERVLLMLPYGNNILAIEDELERNPDNYDLQIKLARAKDEFQVMENKYLSEIKEFAKDTDDDY